MTVSTDDYLKAIYKLEEKSEFVTNKDLSKALGLGAGSISEMFPKLVDKGYIYYQPYRGVQLTQEGKDLAQRIVRSHKVWEVFLVASLGFDPQEVHVMAEKLEHVSSQDLIDRLAQFLDNPTHCPHGGLIPTMHKGGE